MRFRMILAIARAEIRSVRRLVRYWVFAILSTLASLAIYGYYAALHGFLSRLSATVGAIGPRYLASAMGIYLMAIFLLGLIFLAFDVRARDEREHMAEVLDSRPMSNTELLLGRTLGLVLMALAPVLFVVVAYQSFGSLSVMLGWYVGEPVEPYSLAAFMLDALSVFALWSVIVALLAVLMRNRLLVALAALALLGLQFYSLFRMPIYLLPVFGALANAPLASDLTSSQIAAEGLARRADLVILAAGFLALAAALHPRRDGGSKTRRVAIGAALLAAGGLLLGTLGWQAVARKDRRVARLEAHQAHRNDPRADVQAVSGSVRIDPGRRLDLDIELRVQAPADRRLDTLPFTFNPGLAIERLTVGGSDATWTHALGLLEITPSRPLAPGAEALVELVASGRPDITFGYLDTEFDLLSATLIDGNLALLGAEIGVFDSRYVALMPALAWLPHAGGDVPSSDARTHPADYFEADLEVEVPAGWLVAGPGLRQAVDADDDVARFRFSPGAPVPEVGLLASRFERRAMKVAGVELELLVHPTHDRNLRFFADAVDEIESRAEEIFTDAERFGLSYPYGGLTLVESPTLLRGYRGGWRMDTAQAMPGILLLRENSFPTSRFEFEFRNPESFEEREGGISRAKVEAIERFFENDFSGGNVFVGGSRNFMLFQTGARGEGALAIDFVVDELVNQLLTGKRGYFSAFMFDRGSNAAIGQVVTNVATGRTDSIAEAVLNAAADRPAVWDRALGASLADLEPSEDAARTLNVLALKSRAIARSILDGLGREKAAALLAELLSRYRGRHFTAADFQQVAIELDADLEPLIGDWLHEATLPGFVTSPVVVERLADDVLGNPRYQTRVHVLNDEPTPGLLRMRYSTTDDDEQSSVSVRVGPANIDTPTPGGWQVTEPVRVAGHEAVEVGVLSSAPPRELWLQPYLSLNRQDVQLTLPRVDQEAQVSAEPFLGGQASTWRPLETAAIIVDDLDAGFSVESDDEQSGVRLGGGLAGLFAPNVDMDQGLPETGPPGTVRPAVWSRQEAPSSWGKYRHTVALVTSGPGTRRAVFSADLPQSGRWRLSIYIPAGRSAGIGTYDLSLRAGGEERSLEFDGSIAEAGWNTLGDFDLSQGEAKVIVSDESSGLVVIADAIRWEAVPN
jgi:ABC-type transport system involved in multi-copper enzyme maturation permease subunit